ncbi:MAG: B12-binding domain-containing protein [Thermoanaerobaculia bacterium]
MHRALVDGDVREVRGLFLSLYLGQRSPAWIVDHPLREAMTRIGCLWREGIDGVVVEHRATEMALQGLNALRACLPPPEGKTLAVGGGLEGDPYLLPTLAVALVLEAEGVSAVNLGATTPVAALSHAVEAMDADLVWVSVSHVDDAEGRSRELAALARLVAARGGVLVVGGEAVDELAVPPARHVFVGRSMGELEALVRGLRLGGGRPAPAQGVEDSP